MIDIIQLIPLFMNFPEQHENFTRVFAFKGGTIEEVDYDTLHEKDLFFVALRTGKFSLLQKTPEFYDELISGIATREAAENVLREHANKG